MSKICTPTNDEPCYFYHFIECLPRGVKSCAKLWTSVDGMGTGNQGGVNWGNNNTGIKNRGEWCDRPFPIPRVTTSLGTAGTFLSIEKANTYLTRTDPTTDVAIFFID
ncbi:hypothetical protein APUTEX25_000248 [Auxenochlorella protothecoides]|uniref:Uncharacterized protein n=1 Tax=Auxenochlorella protothecoides TaxID=3075 RepID=A0A3M7L106_AUXPR|nr:hypothetical protein APUTEX25_000248 [Auxenochlorella protothecoides]|eukprot:RMZ55665.1 hypothetical protein APUTEX25_000248 [Auxenochlorella protothecoides]